MRKTRVLLLTIGLVINTAVPAQAQLPQYWDRTPYGWRVSRPGGQPTYMDRTPYGWRISRPGQLPEYMDRTPYGWRVTKPLEEDGPSRWTRPRRSRPENHWR